MALKLIANYSKRLGLPGYSSHQFSVSVETEIQNINDVAAEASRLYLTLQKSVDEEIQSTGFVPPDGYGMGGSPAPQSNGSKAHPTNGHKSNGSNSNAAWKCSEKQQDLVLKLMEEHQLSKADVQKLAHEMFGIGEVSSLHKLQASGLIDRLIEEYGGANNRRGITPARGYSKEAGRSR